MKKKLLSVLILSGTAILLNGCNGNPSSSAATKQSNPKTKASDDEPLTLSGVIKTFATGCQDGECQNGAYFVTNSTDLKNIDHNLKNATQQGAQWTNNHYAILVKPGTYDLGEDPFNLGYYTQVVGLGTSNSDVTIKPGVGAFNQGSNLKSAATLSCSTPGTHRSECETIGALNNFWRGIENFTMENNEKNQYGPKNTIFAVSQAAPIRSIHFVGNPLMLCDFHGTPIMNGAAACGFASGGFMANSVVDGEVIPGAQQQWFTRNSKYGTSSSASQQNAVWNTVYSGVDFATPPQPNDCNDTDKKCRKSGTWNNYTVTHEPTNPKSKEKPFLTCGTTCDKDLKDIQWQVVVPQFKTNSKGVDDFSDATSLDVNSTFFIIAPELGKTDNGVTTLDTAVIARINQAVKDGKNLLITPGVYNLDGGTIKIDHNNTIVLGLGLPDLVCTSGTACMTVDDATEGIDIAGITFDAGYKLTPNLLQIGSQNDTSGDDKNPIALHDVFFRVAETQLSTRISGQERQTNAALVIYKNYVYGDYMWIWRADHDKASSTSEEAHKNLVNWDQNRAQYGLIVYGNNVSIDGLMVEHFQDYQTVWAGNDGKVTFYQSEIPYDVRSLEEWVCKDPETQKESKGSGCASYYVTGANHSASGMGVYTYFAFNPIMATSAYIVPSDANITHLVGKWLTGQAGSGYKNLVTNSDHSKCWGYGVNGGGDGGQEKTGKKALSVLSGVDTTTEVTCSNQGE